MTARAITSLIIERELDEKIALRFRWGFAALGAVFVVVLVLTFLGASTRTLTNAPAAPAASVVSPPNLAATALATPTTATSSHDAAYGSEYSYDAALIEATYAKSNQVAASYDFSAVDGVFAAWTKDFEALDKVSNAVAADATASASLKTVANSWISQAPNCYRWSQENDYTAIQPCTDALNEVLVAVGAKPLPQQ